MVRAGSYSAFSIQLSSFSMEPFFQEHGFLALLVSKLQRASGGCLGAECRRRTRLAAKRSGELHKSEDPEISEWGNLAGVMPSHRIVNP
jgi:hypothetical protein